VHYDLEKHIAEEEQSDPGLLGTIHYAESLNHPSVLPGLKTETIADDEWQFELPGLPEDFISQLQITHPDAVTTRFRVANQAIETVWSKSTVVSERPIAIVNPGLPRLYGSGSTF